MKEAPTQRLILDYLAATRVLAFRMNTGQANMGGRYVAFGVPGMADILAFPKETVTVDDEDGCLGAWTCTHCSPLWIECKATDGRQSALQKSFQAQVEAHGHRYVVARTLEDVLPWI